MMSPVGLPEIIRVKISSEAAGYVSLTPVVTRDMPVRELIAMALGTTGLDPERVAGLLRRGSLVSGASRLRWSGLDAPAGEIAGLLATFPASDPSRPFVASNCSLVILRGAGTSIELPREIGKRKRAFRRRSFWDALIDIGQSEPARYVEYSYKDRGDRFAVRLSAASAVRLRERASLLSYSGLEAQVRRAIIDEIEFVIPR